MATVRDTSTENKIDIVTTTENNVTVTQPVTSIVTVSALGPQGAIGPQGPAGEIPSTGSFVLTSSFNSYTGSSDSQFAGTASFAVTASYAANVPLTASYALQALSASYALTASYIENAQTASYVTTAQTASYVLNAISASYSTQALSASYAISASHEIIKEVSSSHADFADTASLAYTASSADQFNVRTALTASGIIYPTTDGDNGDIIYTDGNGNLSFGKTTVYANVKNISGGTLQKGTPVHVTSSVGNTDEIIAASASDASTMPATFVLNETLNDEQEGLAISIGFINNVDTSLFMEGDVVYVGANGGYTNVKPTGSNLIQNLGIVTKVAVNGSGYVLGAGRTNDLPNINPGHIWIGNSDWVPTSTPTSSIQNVVSSSYALTASYLDSYVPPFPFSGSAVITGSLLISSSTNQQLTLIGSGSDQPIFRVQGSEGELFSITDSLSGSLFAINNISGLPILEVFSDDRIIQGDYAAPMLTTTVKNTVSAVGAFTVYELPTASYDGAFFEYTARSGSNARAGQIISIWSGSQVNFTETTTTDFGSTTGLAFTMIVTGSNFALTGSVTTADWTIKTIVRSI